jgi:hypothetical protein
MSLGMMADRLILLILMMSVMNDLLIPRLKAPCPIMIASLRFANFIKMFWLSIYHLSSGIDSMSLILILISEVELRRRSTSSKIRSLLILFISEALDVRKYSCELDVCTRVLI